ncbi:S1C family serine protease [Chloroflexota bacterium]
MKKIICSIIAVSLALLFLVMPFTSCDLIREIESSPPESESPTVTDNTTPIDSDWSIPDTESEAQALPSIADVVAKVKPSVVAINTEIITFDMFNREFTQEGAGSGWIISQDGIIVTNNHVVQDAESITVTLDDGRTFPVDLITVATDETTDLAVLKIDATGLTAASVGDSDRLRIGDWVVAIGNSLGERISATSGIVSALGVSLPVSETQTLYDLVQTDAAINPGNSGGPLVNLAGEVIGITSVKIAEVGVEGMGYAISTSEAMPIIDGLISTGYVIRPWLGVQVYPRLIDEYLVETYGLGVEEGAVITFVVEGSPADMAGLKQLDIVVEFDGKTITDYQDLLRAIHSSEVGKTVEIVFWRGDTQHTGTTTLIKSQPPS